MNTLLPVHFHPTQFPAAVGRDLIASLRRRELNHKFLYVGYRQTRLWLELHRELSPSRVDDECRGAYEAMCGAAVERIDSPAVHVIGLGCGGGRKDRRLMELLRESGRQPDYLPTDVSAPMAITAAQTAAEVIAPGDCRPLVVDLPQAEDLPAVLECLVPGQGPRIVTFFGMIPNFEPDSILARLTAALRPEDLLLFSSNLAPGTDYAAGVETVLPLYDNLPTRRWLTAFLHDIGFEPDDGRLAFGLGPASPHGDCLRIEANYRLGRDRVLQIDADELRFAAGDSVRVFFSNRFSVPHTRDLLDRHGLEVLDHRICSSGEEGVFLCRPTITRSN